MTRRELSRAVNRLGAEEGPFTPILKNKIGFTRKTWYRHQKEHWQGWLCEYAGSGAYGRKSGQRDAAFVYNHIRCTPMLMWLAEAAGVPRARLMRALAAAARGSSAASQCAALRREIPWLVVEESIRRRA
jgi:hypothetical protein